MTNDFRFSICDCRFANDDLRMTNETFVNRKSSSPCALVINLTSEEPHTGFSSASTDGRELGLLRYRQQALKSSVKLSILARIQRKQV